MKNIIIGTPALDGKVDAWYVHSLSETIKLCLSKNILVTPIFLTNESILPMARNELLKIAHDSQCDDFVFIDSDEAWEARAFLDLIESDKRVLGYPVINKTDAEIKFNVELGDIKNLKSENEGNLIKYIKIKHVGTGFLKLTKEVINHLWEESEDVYFRGKILKNIMEYHVDGKDFYGEDVWFCHKLKKLGYDIFINPNYTITHLGSKVFYENFINYLNVIIKE